jgi:alpha-beta hydrolase superfamily lysophospholipase
MAAARGASADTCFADNPASGYACWLWTTNAFTGGSTQWRNNAGDLELNYVYVPPHPDTSRGGARTLMLFLAGTGGSAGAYRNFMAEATMHGYYVIGLA